VQNERDVIEITLL